MTEGPVFNPGGGDDNLTMPADILAQDAPISQYPPGLSIMSATAEANWGENDDPATIVTNNTGSVRFQEAVWRQSGTPNTVYAAHRVWDEDASGWDDWKYLPDGEQIDSAISGALSAHSGDSDAHPQYVKQSDPFYLRSFPEDAWTEDNEAFYYWEGGQGFSVSAGENWGPNAGEAGYVQTWVEVGWLHAIQTFIQYSDNTSYRRVYSEPAWSSWVPA